MAANKQRLFLYRLGFTLRKAAPNKLGRDRKVKPELKVAAGTMVPTLATVYIVPGLILSNLLAIIVFITAAIYTSNKYGRNL